MYNQSSIPFFDVQSDCEKDVLFNHFLGGLQFGNTDFKSRLSYGGGGGGGGGSAFSDDPYPGGRGGNGGGLVYLQLDELTLNGTIAANGTIICELIKIS